MFDFRYHALSLVAVFLALTIGLLLGVAIGDEGLVSTAGEKVRAGLRKDVHAEQARSTKLRRQLRQRDQFADAVYPLLVEGRLSGERVGIVALGKLPGGTIDDVRNALKDTGGRLDTVAVFREPISLDPLSDDTVLSAIDVKPAASHSRAGRLKAAAAAAAANAKAKANPDDPGLIRRYGRAVGADLTQGGPLVRKLRGTLLSTSSGSFNGVEAVVLVRPGGNLKGDDSLAADAFEEGLVVGLTQSNVPVVGTETSDSSPSQIGWFKDRNLASVDNVDQVAGRASLVYALAGARGAFGIKDSADSLLPSAR
jgi:hypothetical protein